MNKGPSQRPVIATVPRRPMLIAIIAAIALLLVVTGAGFAAAILVVASIIAFGLYDHFRRRS